MFHQVTIDEIHFHVDEETESTRTFVKKSKMNVVGFTIARNVTKYDYPILEAIQSILPICDTFVVAVGDSSDDTLDRIKSLQSPKIIILETTWDPSLREGGRVLAEETNKALSAIPADTDWCFYIQGDEVIPETDLPVIERAMRHYQKIDAIDGLLFSYRHFYGSYQYIADSRKWYRREIRLFKAGRGVYSYRDAQGFRKGQNEKLRVALIPAHVHHYGWVKPPEKQMEKIKNTSAFWLSDDRLQAKYGQAPDQFDYSQIDSLVEFTEPHPAVMLPRIAAQSWAFQHDIRLKKYSLKVRILLWIYRLTGWRVGEYRNYILRDIWTS